ncbi:MULTISPECIES: replication initiation and membrane attachment family protein [Bacillaceae]|uniref:replication initiation and membrane attachment family protein n=1 Tax=Bacillaceae TaxID=186817 RepID=UPI001E552967|nr:MULTISPECIES: replication initiation and membrane attachment family protein [Bacillaceae]MCE4051207.1 replication initiation and membrane attachment family protein [Bacillus sp. Au-Bac7]MCM3029884.1 replication initiation and membrane attachment family protein [Niallia sp. MER 6]MDL0436649.1 replication initiation and membrane attachment family protein [Niallia sp. SS-2023]UPO86823.1 replication initiation and membrane attachment family protein [Niallia sp. Man26]
MSQHWQDLLPIDRYQVSTNGLLSEYDRKVITFLYQPLIGTSCLGLYMTLWGEVEENRLWSTDHSHHSLMNFMDCGLKEIYAARSKLEGIGLLKTYMKKEGENRSFIYELQPPLTPEQFFLDGILNVYLFRKIGKAQYNRLKNFFAEERKLDEKEYKPVTKAFQDVFMSDHSSVVRSTYEWEGGEMLDEETILIGKREQKSIKIENNDFDFDLLLAGLNESFLSKKAITTKVKEAIQTLSFLYGINPIEMKNIVMSAINPNDEIDIEELRIAARDWYQFQHGGKYPLLVDRTQPVQWQTQTEAPKSKEEEFLYYLDNTSPRQFLKDIGGGAEPSKADLQIIEEIMFSQKLPPGVINVLIHYVMLKTDMKLTKGYVEKIAGQWVRKKIQTVKAAMELAKREHQQYSDWANGKNTTSNNKAARKVIRKEKIPEWFGVDKTADAKVDAPEKANTENVDNDVLKELEEEIKNLRK